MIASEKPNQSNSNRRVSDASVSRRGFLLALIGLAVPRCKKAEDHYNQGRAYVRKEDYGRAAAAFSKAIEKDPEMARAYFDRGLIYLYHYNQDSDRALSDLSKVIEINPRFGDAYAERALAYVMKEEYNQAWADIQKAENLGVQMDPKFVDAVREGPRRKRNSGATGGGRP